MSMKLTLVIMPPSALEKLANLHIAYPMIFKLSHPLTQQSTHAGVLEFVAEEGRVYLPQWMMKQLSLKDGDLVQLKSTSLPLGTFVKIEPQHVSFLDITDPKAVLENAFRNFSTLTCGDIFTFRYNEKLYDIRVVETKPSNGISIVETDLEVDFLPPVGYVEPPSRRTSIAPSVQESIHSVKQYIVQRPEDFKAFVGSGAKLNGKLASENVDPNDSDAPAVEFPLGKLFFGYPIVSRKGKESNESTAFQGQGQSLRKAK